ncbi:hypothetical protein Tco_1077388 [Tanacetum coccineum]
MARQCTQPKQKKDAAWFKEKTDDLDAYNFDCDDISSAKAVLMANLSSCDSDVLSELNNIAKDFGKRFVLQQELFAEQKFWLQSSDKNSEEPSTSNTPVKIEVPSELPKVSKPHATTIDPGMYKLNLEPLVPKVLKNKDAHLEYIKHSREHANILQEIVESARALCPLDSNLDSALIGSTGASGSKPTSNTKNNRISQSSSSNKTNKVEGQSRSVKSRKNKKNRVAKTKCNAYVMQSMLNTNSKSLCAICNECLFDANHDKCVLDYVQDVNVLSKSTPAKHKNNKQIWKPTSKVYTKIGYKWKPFTIVKNKCPLTRFTPTKVVPLKETTTKSVVTPIQGIMVYSIRPKAPI